MVTLTIVMHSELSTTTLYHISNLQTPLRYSWYSSAAAETCLLLRVTALTTAVDFEEETQRAKREERERKKAKKRAFIRNKEYPCNTLE